MKVLLITGIWILLYLSTTVFQACVNCDPDPLNFQLASIEGTTKRITEIINAGDTKYLTTEPYVASTGIRYDSVGLDVVNEIKSLAVSNKTPFIQQAFACSPVEIFDIYESISITSSSDYLPEFPKGSNLTEIMLVRQGNGAKGYEVDTYLKDIEAMNQSLFFSFKLPPSENKTHDLTIKYKLRSGREVTTSLNGIAITK